MHLADADVLYCQKCPFVSTGASLDVEAHMLRCQQQLRVSRPIDINGCDPYSVNAAFVCNSCLVVKSVTAHQILLKHVSSKKLGVINHGLHEWQESYTRVHVCQYVHFTSQ